MKVPSDFGVDDDALVSITVPSDLRAVKQPEADLMAELKRHGYAHDTLFAIKLAFEEAVTNAVKHGNRDDPTKHIHLRYYVDAQRTVLMVRDEGGGFHPGHVPDPTQDENLERPSGRGLMLMYSYMTKVRFSRSGNEVCLLKENAPAQRP